MSFMFAPADPSTFRVTLNFGSSSIPTINWHCHFSDPCVLCTPNPAVEPSARNSRSLRCPFHDVFRGHCCAQPNGHEPSETCFFEYFLLCGTVDVCQAALENAEVSQAVLDAEVPSLTKLSTTVFFWTDGYSQHFDEATSEISPSSSSLSRSAHRARFAPEACGSSKRCASPNSVSFSELSLAREAHRGRSADAADDTCTSLAAAAHGDSAPTQLPRSAMSLGAARA
mmetsp:Transcript_25209/g.66070  ORF Transcript_25209/g.66070 Transcript_25209/m.66070 type:complete len:227 (+) Transcript_25209:492-1172(+)